MNASVEFALSSHRPLLPLLAAAAVFSITSGSVRARACSPPQCTPIHVAPEAGRTLPSNGVVVVEPGSDVDLGRIWPTLSLRRSDGTPIVATWTEVTTSSGPVRVYAVAGGLPIGTNVASYDERCLLGSVVPAEKREVAFSTTESRPLPSSLGSLTVETSLRTISVGASGPCEIDTLAAIAQLTVTSSPELEPWLALVRRTTRVDGAAWATSPAGGLGPASSFVRADRLYAACAPPAGAFAGLPTGAHVVTVQADVPGLFAVPPVAATIDLRCDVDAGVPEVGASDAGADADGSRDAATHDGAAAASEASSAGCGCGTARSAPAGATLVLCGFLALHSIGRLRRRGRAEEVPARSVTACRRGARRSRATTAPPRSRRRRRAARAPRTAPR